MKIVLFSHAFLPKIGGRELVVHYLAKSLTQLGHNIRVVGPSMSWERMRMDFGYKVHMYPSITRTRLGDTSFLSRLREREVGWQLRADTSVWGCDVIHAHTTYPSGYIAGKMRGDSKKPVIVVTPHGYDINVIPDMGFGMRLDPVLNHKIQAALKQADAITSISEGIESSLLDAGADSQKIFRIPNGVDTHRFEIKPVINVFDALNIPGESRLIVTVGNYHPRKGHEILIRAMSKIVEQVPQARLVIIGKNSQILTPLINELGLQKNVVLAGVVKFPKLNVNKHGSDHLPMEDDLLSAIYQKCDLYVSAGTTQGSEGLSLAVLEAMAAGTPVIGTSIAGNIDVIKDGENGFLVRPTNVEDLQLRIVQLLNDTQLRHQMAAKAKETVAGFNWIQIAQQYVDLYKQFLPKG